jgi:hypothetical protein
MFKHAEDMEPARRPARHWRGAGATLPGAVKVSTVAATAVVVLALLAPESGAQRGAGPFADMAGTWSGSGSITLSSGASERIRCRSAYALVEGGSTLQQDLRCASDSYRFDLRSDISHRQDGTLHGRWVETSRNVSGSLSGRLSGDQIQARVEGPGFSASLTMSTRGERQSVSIQSAGTEVTGLSITLTRGAR